MTALEPILLIVIGVLVGGTVLAIITPIYDVTGSIR
jgi:type II secretory pathway component PulF